MKDPETIYEGIIHNLKSALQEIAGGTKVRKNKGACAQINLSAVEMQEIAAKALAENKDE